MTDKIIYFTAGRTATTAEKAEIEEIRELCVAPYEIAVRNPLDSPNYGAGPEAAVYAAGTVPDVEPYKSLPVFDPDAPPVDLPATQAIVANGGTVAVRNSAGADSHNATAVVAANAVTGVNLAATVGIVDNNDTIAVQRSTGTVVGGNGTAIVAAGVVSAIRLPAATALAVAGAQTGITVTGTGANVAFTVANGAITGITLS